MHPPSPTAPSSDTLSLVRGIPLEDEPGLGALTIPGYVREVAQRYAGREAVVLRQGDGSRVSWSYEALWQHALQVAKALIAENVGKGTRVGVLMANRPEYLSTLFGVALAGGVTASLSTFSTPAELEVLLKGSAISVLLYDRKVLKTDFGAMLCELEPRLKVAAPGALRSERFPYLRTVVSLEPVATTGDAPAADGAGVIRFEDFIAGGEAVPETIVTARAATVTPADPGGLFFSSGTTSTPKAILHRQRAFAIQWWRWPRVLGVQEPVRAWTGNGFFWSANITMVVGCALSTGGAVVLQPTFEPQATLELLTAERVTLMNGRPHQWARLQSAQGWSAADLSAVRYVTRGDIIKQHPTVSTPWERPNSFGTTETMTILSAFTANTPPRERADSFGAPLPGNTLKIVDPDSGLVLRRGERGEICIKGPTLMVGYGDKSPEETFDEDGYFHTGDGGYVDELGRLYWEGRLKHMIKTGGANVSPEEVDGLIASFPGVHRTQTVGVPHATLSEMVVACIVPSSGTTLDEGELLTHLKRQLASFKVPRKLLLFTEQEFPVTGNEKAKVENIRKLAAARLGTAGETSASD